MFPCGSFPSPALKGYVSDGLCHSAEPNAFFAPTLFVSIDVFRTPAVISPAPAPARIAFGLKYIVDVLMSPVTPPISLRASGRLTPIAMEMSMSLKAMNPTTRPAMTRSGTGVSLR